MAAGPETAEALVHVSYLIEEAFERRAREHRVSPILARLLRILSDRSPTINELGELIGLDKSSTSGLVARAQRRGLVRRVPSQLDRRSVRVRLTADGRELLGRVQTPFVGDVRAMLESLAPEARERLGHALDQLLSGQARR